MSWSSEGKGIDVNTDCSKGAEEEKGSLGCVRRVNCAEDLHQCMETAGE